MLAGWFLHFGYAMVVIASAVEGDATLLTATYLAHRGYLRLDLVVLSAMLGTIALAGMIMRNSIILIDQIDQDLAQGIAPWEAVVGSTLRRFRPIVLTALAAILAMIPLTRSTFWGPMAWAIMGGLTVATALTLIVLPAMYAAWYRVKPPVAGQPAAVFVAALAAGVLHQDAAHGQRGGGEEVAAAVPTRLDADPRHQAQVRLVDQGRGVERLARFLVGQLVGRQPAQLVVNQRQELFGRLGVALLDRRQNAGDVAHGEEPRDRSWQDSDSTPGRAGIPPLSRSAPIQ